MKSGLWKDSVAFAIVLLLVVLFLVGFHRYAGLGKGLSLDGYATVATTLLAAALGFGAVMLQLRAQHRTADEERKSQRLAVAAAISAEIDDFYGFFLKDFRARVMKRWYPEGINMAGMEAPELGPLPATALVVYRSTAHQLGTLSVASVKSVVGLYNFMASFVETYETYRRAWSSSTKLDSELRMKLLDVFNVVPRLILDSCRACELLAKEQERPFDGSGFSLGGLLEVAENGQTMKQVLEGEAASVRECISKS